MKKVAILTLNGYVNYGNRLQNYATQEVLKSLGFAVETIINDTRTGDKSNEKRGLLERFNNLEGIAARELLKKVNYKLWKLTHKSKIQEYEAKRIKTFKDFTLNHILETDYCISDTNIPSDLEDRYDYFITGSDQVWNPFYTYGSSIYFLTFASENKRIAYSPSFGISEIPSEHLEKYKNNISEMHRLSVREDAGAQIIKKLTGRNAVVLVDPTLMLTKEKWLSISKEATNKPRSKYLLTYFLGTISNNYEMKIKKIARNNKLKIINLADIKDWETYKTGPSEFIDYIGSASLFCTDSFHGVVFSILMEVPFIVFERISNDLSMYSRIDTLLAKFKLESRKSHNIITNEQIFKVDYSHVSSILEIERKKVLDYLKEALNLSSES